MDEQHPVTILYAEDDGTITASIGKPTAMFAAVENPKVKAVATEVDAMIERVVEAL